MNHIYKEFKVMKEKKYVNDASMKCYATGQFQKLKSQSKTDDCLAFIFNQPPWKESNYLEPLTELAIPGFSATSRYISIEINKNILPSNFFEENLKNTSYQPIQFKLNYPINHKEEQPLQNKILKNEFPKNMKEEKKKVI